MKKKSKGSGDTDKVLGYMGKEDLNPVLKENKEGSLTLGASAVKPEKTDEILLFIPALESEKVSNGLERGDNGTGYDTRADFDDK